MCIKQQCKDSYERLENLKLVSGEVGIPWQTVYVHLKSISGFRLRVTSQNMDLTLTLLELRQSSISQTLYPPLST